MSDAKCPSCSAVLNQRELNEGWCNGCGKRVPMHVYHSAGLKGPKEHALPASAHAPLPMTMAMDPEEKLPIWQLALIGAAILAIAAVILGTMI